MVSTLGLLEARRPAGRRGEATTGFLSAPGAVIRIVDRVIDERLFHWHMQSLNSRSPITRSPITRFRIKSLSARQF
jgi:hypothetical protein